MAVHALKNKEVEKIILALDLQHDEESWQTLLDLAAEERNDLPADIKDYLMGNYTLQALIRKMQKLPNSEQLCIKQLHELS